jgi:hypothetical protein
MHQVERRPCAGLMSGTEMRPIVPDMNYDPGGKILSNMSNSLLCLIYSPGAEGPLEPWGGYLAWILAGLIFYLFRRSYEAHRNEILVIPYKSVPIIASYTMREFQGNTITTTFAISDTRDHTLKLTRRDRLNDPVAWFWMLIYGSFCFEFLLASVYAIGVFAGTNAWTASEKTFRIPTHLVILAVIWFFAAFVISAYGAYRLSARHIGRAEMYKQALDERGADPKTRLACIKLSDWDGFCRNLR